MNRIIIDQASMAKLGALDQSAELCDETGRILGYFTPTHDRSLYEGVEPPISAEELERRFQGGGGRPLADIMADLEQRS
jgi:hypothetical protein